MLMRTVLNYKMTLNSPAAQKDTKTALNSFSKELRYNVPDSLVYGYRLFACAVLFVSMVMMVYLEKSMILYRLMAFFTNWGLMLTIAYFTLNTLYYTDKRLTYNLNILFHFSFSAEILITLIYWVMIVPARKETGFSTHWMHVYDDHWLDNFCLEFLLVFHHTIPLVLLVIDMFLNRIVLVTSHFNYWFGLMLLYLSFNAFYVIKLDWVVYAILTYDSIGDVKLVIAIFLVSFMCFFTPILLQKIKYRNVSA